MRIIWALFDGNDEHYGRGVFDYPGYAHDDLSGRPADVRVERACQCMGPVRPAYECPVCSMTEEE